MKVTSREDGAGWLSCLHSLVARRLSGVELVVSDAHLGLVQAIRSHAARHRLAARTCYLRNLLTIVPKSAQP